MGSRGPVVRAGFRVTDVHGMEEGMGGCDGIAGNSMAIIDEQSGGARDEQQNQLSTSSALVRRFSVQTRGGLWLLGELAGRQGEGLCWCCAVLGEDSMLLVLCLCCRDKGK